MNDPENTHTNIIIQTELEIYIYMHLTAMNENTVHEFEKKARKVSGRRIYILREEREGKEHN